MPKDWAFAGAAWMGILLSAVVVAGVADRYTSWFNALVWAGIWVFYISFVNVGQTFYAFGWESILLEAGFFAIFLGARSATTPLMTIYLLRWLEFRVMFGAGLIKMRGDPCWRNLTCLDYHYETQPMPNPLSWYFHNAPQWTHEAGVAFNHFAELFVPFCYFLPQPIAHCRRCDHHRFPGHDPLQRQSLVAELSDHGSRHPGHRRPLACAADSRSRTADLRRRA